MNIERIEKTLFSMQDRLLNNQDLLKLLYYADNNPLLNDDVSRSDGENLIKLNPMFKYGPTESINNFISLGLPNVNDLDDYTVIQFDIAVFCSNNNWVLDNRQIRIMQIIKEIQLTLENKNFNTSGALIITDMTPAVLDDLGFAGYYITGKVVDNIQELPI